LTPMRGTRESRYKGMKKESNDQDSILRPPYLGRRPYPVRVDFFHPLPVIRIDGEFREKNGGIPVFIQGFGGNRQKCLEWKGMSSRS
jgi:hypothetical protein